MTDTSGLCVMPTHGRGANGEPLQREADVGLLCHWHRRKLSDLLVEVRLLWIDLAFIDQPGSAPKDETPKTRHLKSAEAPAPANLEVLALRDVRTRNQRLAPTVANPDGDQSEPLDDVMGKIAGWVRVVAEERPIADDLLPYSTVAQLELLHRHADWIAAQDWVDDLFGEFSDLQKLLRAALHDQPYRRIGRCRLPVVDEETGISSVCGGPLLQENGSDGIRCAECAATWTTPREQWLLHRSLEAS